MALSKIYREVSYCELDESSTYRYVLEVLLTSGVDNNPLIVILKNPSTADATKTDPTTNHVEAWARHHGFTSVTYLNLFAYRAVKPTMLKEFSYEDIVGPQNNHRLNQYLRHDSTVIIAWGNPNGINKTVYDKRIREVRLRIRSKKATAHVVKRISDGGYPLHGLCWGRDFPYHKVYGLEKEKGIFYDDIADYHLYDEVFNEQKT